MNICYLANVRFPSERAHTVNIFHMCQLFARLGHRVLLITNNRKNPVKDSIEEYYGEEVQFEHVRKYAPDIAPYGRIFFVFAAWIFALFSLRVLNTSKCDIVYSRDEWVLACVLFFRPRCKAVYESHEAKYSFPVRFLARRAVPFVVISEGIRDFYRTKGIADERICVAHDGIDETFFGAVESKEEARARLGIESDKPVAMYIGGLDAWKGVDTFLNAAHEAPDVRFVVIGGKLEEIERYQKQYPDVTFLGQRPYRELKDNQQAADVLVIPNTGTNDLSAKYTSPLKLFAHMTSGIPTVAADIPSMREVLNDKNAILVNSDDPEALANGIRIVLEDPRRAETLGRQARTDVERFTWKNRARNVQFFVENTLHVSD